MQKGASISLLAILWILLTLTPSLQTPPVIHAQLVGVVCVTVATETSCPTTPITITGTAGTQLDIAINIQDSDSINAYDIFVKADPQALRPTSIDTTGTVLGSNTLTLASCIESTGPGCTALQNGPGVVRSAIAALGLATQTPTTGRLFRISYNVMIDLPSVKVGFQTGCSSTSAGDFCVTVARGGTVVPETLLESAGTFGDFTIAAFPTALAIRKGTFGLAALVFASQAGFFGGISLEVNVAPRKRAAPTLIFLSGPAVALEPGTSAMDLVRIDASRTTPVGQYFVTVTATSGDKIHSASIIVFVSSG